MLPHSGNGGPIFSSASGRRRGEVLDSPMMSPPERIARISNIEKKATEREKRDRERKKTRERKGRM